MEYALKDFGKILKKNALQQRRLMLQSGTTCMRIYDRNLAELDVTVDLYGPYARIADYSEEGLEEKQVEACCDIVSRMAYVEADHVIFQRREKRVGREQHEVSDEQSLLVEVEENSLVFTVDLTKRIDTGLFLDHMPTRALVAQMSLGKRVLNLFSYTGSFSVYSARGGAMSVESVDLSATYTRWAEKNLAANGYTGDLYRCVADDARAYLEKAQQEGRRYDLVIFDPPSFSNSRKMAYDFDVQRDYLAFLETIYYLLSDGAVVLFSTNLQTFRMDVAALAGYEVKEITREVLAPGFSRKRATTRTWIATKRGLHARKRPVLLRDAGKNQLKERKINPMDSEQSKENKEQEVLVEESVTEQQEPVTSEANVVEDDLLVLNWEEPEVESIEQEEKPKERKGRERARDDRRPPRKDRDDRRSYQDQDDRRSSYRDRDDRRPYRDRDDRRSSYRDRDDRRPYRDRDDRRPSYRDRDDRRPSYRDRDDRRPSYRDRDDRRPSYHDRDDRPYYRDRDDRRSSYRDRDDRRPPYRDRDDRRPSYRDRDDRRPSYRDRDDRRPSYRDRDDRGPYRGQDDRRSSYRDRDDRRPSYRDDRRPYRDRDDRRPSYRDRDDRRSAPRGGDRFQAERPKRERDFKPRPYGYDRFERGSRKRGEERDPFLPRKDEE